MAAMTVLSVWAAVGPAVDILVEAHAKLDVMAAVQRGKWLEAYHPRL